MQAEVLWTFPWIHDAAGVNTVTRAFAANIHMKRLTPGLFRVIIPHSDLPRVLSAHPAWTSNTLLCQRENVIIIARAVTNVCIIVFVGVFSPVTTITHEPLHLAWWYFAWTCTLTTGQTVFNLKVVDQRSRSFFFVFRPMTLKFSGFPATCSCKILSSWNVRMSEETLIRMFKHSPRVWQIYGRLQDTLQCVCIALRLLAGKA